MRLKQFIIAVLAVCAAPIAFGATASAYLGVTLTVVPNCQVAVTDLHFGTYDPLLANATQALDATADLSMLCTKGSQATIRLDFGRNAVGPTRGMAQGTDRVAYNLFQDSSRSTPWADGEQAMHVVGSGGSAPQRHVIFGRVSPGQEVPPGAYSDVVMATVDF